MKKWFIVLFLALAAIPLMAQDTPTLGDLPSGEWSEIPMAGLKCLYDTDYAFFVRPASTPTDDLMIYFEGGGACWNGFTCGARGQFASQFEVTDEEMSVNAGGLLDFSNDENPVQNYNAVFVPYCSGDVHSGSVADVTLPIPPETGLPDSEVTVSFTGFDNASAVLNWVYDNYTDPSQVLVTGCSAGGYGAVTHSAYVMNHYPDTRVVMLADASTGVTPKAWEGLQLWGTLGTLPQFVPAFVDVKPERYSTTFHIREIAKAFPNNVFAEYNTFLDQVQIGFYGFQTDRVVDASNFAIVGVEWARQLLSNLYSLEATTPNFYNYLAGGMVHCITPSDITYTYEVQGVRFVDWVQSLLDGSVDSSPSCNVSAGECNLPPATE